jgi:CheY-like chemotaxis protein
VSERGNLRTILVAEDDDAARALVKKYLEGKGHTVRVVADGQSALDELAATDDIDVVLLDIMMPKLSGLDVLAELRRRGDRTPVIMATAASSPDDIVKALSLGADDYVTKPYSFPVLLARIDLRLRLRAPDLQTTVDVAPLGAASHPTPDPALLERLRRVADRWRSAPTPLDELAPGVVVAERYVVEASIGAGGYGAVWRARHIDLAQDVAIKVLHEDIARGSADRFRKEAQKASRVRHGNAVRVLDFGELAHGAAFLVMELLDGPPLETVIRAEAPLPWRRCVEVLAPITAALAAAHKQGIVHRDVKPANIVLHRDDDGTSVPKLLDFGVAKDLGDLTDDSGGLIVGSPAYLAPERLRGNPYDGRSDIYACGIMLHRMLTGLLPFDETINEFEKVALWHVSAPPPRPSERTAGIPAAVDDACLAMMCKDPAHRPNAREAYALLTAALEVSSDT